MKLLYFITTLLQAPYVWQVGGFLFVAGAVFIVIPRLEGYDRDHWIIRSGWAALLFGMMLIILYWVSLSCYPLHAPAIVGGFAIYTNNDMW